MTVYRVLVVDDNHEVRRMVTASIKSLGAEIEVLEVPSAEEAMVISATLPLDLVVLDYRLPGMSGMEMVTRLRKRKPGTKIILVTGINDDNIRQQVSEAGVEAYFFKPIEIKAFLDAVKHSLWADQVGAIPPPGTAGKGITPPSPGKSLIGKTVTDRGPTVSGAKTAALRNIHPTLAERMTALKQQIRAISAILLDESGQVLEQIGNVSEITSDQTLLPALMQTFRSMVKVSDTFGMEATESMLYFTRGRQRIYLAPIALSNALLIITTGYFELDKLGLLDRAIHRAVDELHDILEQMREEANLISDDAGDEQTELPADIIVDQETLSGVENIFSRASKRGIQEEADGFWEALGENGELNAASDKGVISYDQARDLGLAPEDGNP